jgi:uncharacterized membrane protein
MEAMMAILAMIFGSVVGLVGAIFGWFFWDMTLMNAFGFYMGSALGSTLLGVLAVATAPDEDFGPASGL